MLIQRFSRKLRLNLNFQEFIIFIIYLGIIISPLINNQERLPRGWELPKVYFWQILSIILLTLILIKYLINAFQNKKLEIKKSSVIFATILLFFWLIAFSSEIKQIVTREESYNPLYELLARFFGFDDKSGNFKITIFGNSFRESGILTITLLVSLFWCIKDYLSKKTWCLIMIALIVSSLIQSFLGVSQFIDYYFRSPELLREGKWVYGTFGQTNFYAGHLLIGLTASLYFLRGKFSKYALFSCLFIILGIVISLSYWSYGVLALIIIFITIYENLSLDRTKLILQKTKIMIPILLLISFPIIYKLLEIVSPHEFRFKIWKAVYSAYTGNSFHDKLNFASLKTLFFGSGFDTLAEFLWSKGKMRGMYVDRAHNFFFDILASTGIIGLLLFSIMLTKLTSLTKSLVKSREFIYSVFLVTIWLTRSQLHTCSVVNLVDFLTICVLTHAARKFTNVTGKS